MRNRKKSILIGWIFLCLMTLMLSGCAGQDQDLSSLSQLNDKSVTIATWSSVATDNAMKEHFPKANKRLIDTISVLITNLKGNKIDAVLTSRIFYDTFPNKSGLKVIEGDLGCGEYGFFFAQTEKGKKLRDEMNEFIVKANESGLTTQLEEIWLGETVIGRPIGKGSLDPDAPAVVFAFEYETPPFGYIENNTSLGFDVDFAECFCEEYGYRFKPVGLPFSMIASGDLTGEYDFAGGALEIDDDMKASKILSEPHFISPFIVVVRDSETQTSLFSSAGESLRRTLLENGRWKMYLRGLLSTLLITALSAAAGTLLGFLVYLIDINAGKAFHKTVGALFTVIHITPIVVLLMIFYHVIFHGVHISGTLVSAIVFTLMMTGTVYELMVSSVGAIDRGQREAAIALGCTPSQAFFRVVLPQALRHFLPLYKGEMINLVKLTSVVGYIAVQDLTKVSDIIRSQTFDAFFPLFSAAVIYILLALLMIWLVNLLFRKTDPRNRSREKIVPAVSGGKEAAK